MENAVENGDQVLADELRREACGMIDDGNATTLAEEACRRQDISPYNPHYDTYIAIGRSVALETMAETRQEVRYKAISAAAVEASTQAGLTEADVDVKNPAYHWVRTAVKAAILHFAGVHTEATP